MFSKLLNNYNILELNSFQQLIVFTKYRLLFQVLFRKLNTVRRSVNMQVFSKLDFTGICCDTNVNDVNK